MQKEALFEITNMILLSKKENVRKPNDNAYFAFSKEIKVKILKLAFVNLVTLA